MTKKIDKVADKTEDAGRKLGRTTRDAADTAADKIREAGRKVGEKVKDIGEETEEAGDEMKKR
jgi:hypothetical protein